MNSKNYNLLTSLPFFNSKLNAEGINLFLKEEISSYFENVCLLIEEKANF